MLSALIEIAGLACIAVAGWMVYRPLGILLAGTALLLVGHALDGVRIPWPRIRMPRLRAPRIWVPWRRPVRDRP